MEMLPLELLLSWVRVKLLGWIAWTDTACICLPFKESCRLRKGWSVNLKIKQNLENKRHLHFVPLMIIDGIFCYSVHYSLSEPEKHSCRQGKVQMTDDPQKRDSYNTGLWNCLHKQGLISMGFCWWCFFFYCQLFNFFIRLLWVTACEFAGRGVFWRREFKQWERNCCFPGLKSIFWKVLALKMASCKYNYSILIFQTNGALLLWLFCESAVFKEVTFKGFMQKFFCLLYWGFLLLGFEWLFFF